MSSNHLVTHQAHKNGQYYALKPSKILFNCKRDSRMTQKFQFFQNFQMASKMFLDIVVVITTSKLSILSTFQGVAPGAPPCQVGLNHLKNHSTATLTVEEEENLEVTSRF